MLEVNKIHNMDCFEGIGKLDDKSIDLIVTDPPYKFENKGGGFYADNNSTKRVYLDSLRNINCTEFEPIPFLNLVKPKMKKFYGYFFCNKFLVEEYIKFARDNKYNFDILVMGKTNPIPSYNNHHLSDLEYIIMIREKGTYFSKHKELDDFRKFYMTSCKKGIHPSEKPIELIERYIRVSSKENDLILDPFMGSGTTGVACKKNNRNFIGFEIDEYFSNLSNERVNNYE
jgi:DNA modification methylase